MFRPKRFHMFLKVSNCFCNPEIDRWQSAEWEGHVFKSEGLYEFSILGQRVSAYSINSKVDALGLKFYTLLTKD